MSDENIHLIDLMIIGAQKSGTTSLLYYLGEHPEICAHPQKEFAYFLEPDEYNLRYDKAFSKYYPHFNPEIHKVIVGKSASLYSHPEALERLKEHNPNCRIVIILRNPIERTYSSFLMEKNAGNATMRFTELLDGIRKNKYADLKYILDFSFYSTHLKNLYRIFPSSRVSVYFYEDLKYKAAGICQELFGLLNIDKNFIPDVTKIHNPTNKMRSEGLTKVIVQFLKKDNIIRKSIRRIIPDSKAYKIGDIMRKSIVTNDKYPEMDANTKKLLREYFKEEIQTLQTLTGKDLSHWLGLPTIVQPE